MKLARFCIDGTVRAGLVTADGAGLVDIARHVPEAPADTLALIARWDEFKPRLGQAGPDLALSEVKLQAPIRQPGKILCIGLNYKDHIEETHSKTPEFPIFFGKTGNTAAGPGDPIELPAASVQLDYEVELVAVIGRRCRNVPRARAGEVIFGYCVGNDVSVRDWQTRTSQWFLGKSVDGHAPIGPWITTADTVDPHGLGIRSVINGEVRQNSNTRHLLFDIGVQIETLSTMMTLDPGDVIFTGTPGGVAQGFTPPRWLKEGDVVRVEIDQLGGFENPVVAGPREMFIA